MSSRSPLTPAQALAIRECLGSKDRRVAYRRAFLNGNMPPRCVASTVAKRLCEKKLGQMVPGTKPDEGHFVLNKQGEEAYEQHRKSIAG